MRVTQPRRVARTFTQRIAAAPAAVFPLLCPVREADWIEGWDPVVVFSESGVAEPDCVFVTGSGPDSAIWYITRREPDAFVEMIRITPTVTACRLTIRLEVVPEGTHATVTYTHTSLGEAGDRFLDGFTQAAYDDAMRGWEARMNHYLATGALLRDAEIAGR